MLVGGRGGLADGDDDVFEKQVVEVAGLGAVKGDSLFAWLRADMGGFVRRTGRAWRIGGRFGGREEEDTAFLRFVEKRRWPRTSSPPIKSIG